MDAEKTVQLSCDKVINKLSSGPNSRTDNAVSIPEIIGRYEIITQIGFGSTGRVFLARLLDAQVARAFALKLMHGHLVDRDSRAVRRFLTEARVAAGLRHINVVPLLEVGFHEDVPFLVMDYVEGCSLGFLFRAGYDSQTQRTGMTISIVLDVLAGLHAVHSFEGLDGSALGLVHRDVSPANIIVGLDGAARLTDFGVARSTMDEDQTISGNIRGTPGYISPEELTGGELDARSDLFSVGVLLWNGLTARSLFDGGSQMSTLYNVVGRPVPPPSRIGLRPPPEFDAICLRALARDRKHRYNSALEMATELREVAIRLGLLPSYSDVAQWVGLVAGEQLKQRSQQMNETRTGWTRTSLKPEVESSSGPLSTHSGFILFFVALLSIASMAVSVIDAYT